VKGLSVLSIAFLFCFAPLLKIVAPRVVYVTNTIRSIQNNTHTYTLLCETSLSSLFPFFSFFLCLLVCLCVIYDVYEIRVFELKSQVKTHAPQHLLHALPGGGRVVGAKARTHIYTHTSVTRGFVLVLPSNASV